MSRDDLLGINLKVMEQVGAGIKKYAPERLRHLHHQPARRDGLGAAEVLRPAQEPWSSAWPACSTSARFRHFLAEEFKVSVEDVTAFVLGGHGDTMVPLTRYSTVAGIPLPDLVKMGWITKEKLDADRPAHPRRRRRDRRPAEDRLGLLRAGRFGDRRWPRATSRTRSACCPARRYLSGQYGVKDIYVGVPVVIGAGGVERVIEIDLNKAEQKMFDKSVGVGRRRSAKPASRSRRTWPRNQAPPGQSP